MTYKRYKEGALKRKFKMGRVETSPGDLISKMNEQKRQFARKASEAKLSRKEKVSIMGLV